MKAKAYLKICLATLITVIFFTLSTTPLAYSAIASATGSTFQFTIEENAAQFELKNYYLQLAYEAGYRTHDAFEDDPNMFYPAVEGEGEPYSIALHNSHGHLGGWWHYYWLGWDWHDHYEIWQYCNSFYDNDIYPHSKDQNLRFAFVYACHSADVIGEMKTYPCGAVEPFGMPFAWLHTNSLSADGYVNPDGSGRCFIGFEGKGPVLTYDLLINDRIIYDAMLNFTKDFYYGALKLRYTVNQALDYAANATFTVGSFFDSVLYTGYDIPGFGPGKMKVYGDGYIRIGEPPLMKTTVDPQYIGKQELGQFYVPAYTKRLKIELLFNATLVGDQIGKASPYSTYPNRLVE
jgi:hypothetical protein